MRRQILEAYGWRCAVRLPGCTGAASSVDHVVPLSKGGAPLDPSNLRASCPSCNAKKGGKLDERKPRSREW